MIVKKKRVIMVTHKSTGQIEIWDMYKSVRLQYNLTKHQIEYAMRNTGKFENEELIINPMPILTVKENNYSRKIGEN